jgi:beta-1,4-mannosyl-glycoprotein beta-1,4-N-acetylglucosaminyltransferase
VRIWDTFLLRDELDMLECRLVQLENSAVYRHVLCEARTDHQGHPKPLFFAENRERFAPWLDRIIHVVADLPAEPGISAEKAEHPASPAAWAREAFQRDQLAGGLEGAADDDWLILADVDEIPGAAGMEAVSGRAQGVFEMTACCFAVDLVLGQIRASPVMRAGAVSGTLSRARRDGWGGPVIPRAGHHLSWLGGPEAVRAKMAAHCHAEVNEDIAGAISGGIPRAAAPSPFGRYGYSGLLLAAEIDGSWPKWVRERRCPPSWFRSWQES